MTDFNELMRRPFEAPQPDPGVEPTTHALDTWRAAIGGNPPPTDLRTDPVKAAESWRAAVEATAGGSPYLGPKPVAQGGTP